VDNPKSESKQYANVLEVKDLRTYFHTPEGIVKAVDNLSFSVGKGEVLGLVGESGCGKSVTSLSIMGLIETPGSIEGGSIKFLGKELIGLSWGELKSIRGKRISIIFQDPMTSLNPLFTVGKQITEVLIAHEKITKREAFEVAVSLLNETGIGSPRKRMQDYPHQMSGGMRQRVMIAIALACNPDLVIADESTTALDVTIQAQILDVLRRLVDKRGTSVIFVTHDLGLISEMCDRVVVMYAGKKFEEGKTKDIFKNPLHPYTRGLMLALPEGKVRGEKLKTIRGVVPIPIDLPDTCRFRDRCDEYDELYCKAGEPKMLSVGNSHYVACYRFYKEEDQADASIR
jgi:oligopeptide/dipeptide ABC transporter ATP-binding protein